MECDEVRILTLVAEITMKVKKTLVETVVGSTLGGIIVDALSPVISPVIGYDSKLASTIEQEKQGGDNGKSKK